MAGRYVKCPLGTELQDKDDIVLIPEERVEADDVLVPIKQKELQQHLPQAT